MEFFTTSDLEYFSSVIGRKFKQGDPVFEEVGIKLKNDGVYAKTAFWAKLIEEEGYLVEPSFYWQIAGVIRKYTWARILLNEYAGSHVFFTIGVGSRLTHDNLFVTTLEYKLDCHRKKLTAAQIQAFDAFLVEQDGHYPWKTIEIDDLHNYSWDSLKERTLKFIDDHKEHYTSCANFIWPNGLGEDPINLQSKLRKYVFEEGHNISKKGKINVKKTSIAYQKLLLHEEIKEKLYFQFINEYTDTSLKVGTEVSTGYGKYVDIVVKKSEKEDIFYEIKSGPNALSCIREAIGQILEYCYYPDNKNAIKLVIVSPNKLNELEKMYMSQLRNETGIALYYQQYNIESEELDKNLF